MTGAQALQGVGERGCDLVLDDVAVGAGIERGEHMTAVIVARYDQDAQVGVDGAQTVDRARAASAGHLHVDDGDVEGLGRHGVYGGIAVANFGGAVPRSGDHEGHQVAGGGVVINDQAAHNVY